MDDKQIINSMNKILTLEHGHLGMYRNFRNHQDKEICRTFRRFMDIEIDHIRKLDQIILNLGGKPSPLAEGGDILGKVFGIAMNFRDDKELLKTYSSIEKKSHLGYTNLIKKLEEAGKKEQFIAEIASANMLEAKLMFLWLDDKLKSI